MNLKSKFFLIYKTGRSKTYIDDLIYWQFPIYIGKGHLEYFGDYVLIFEIGP
jgi:hypothetical protein